MAQVFKASDVFPQLPHEPDVVYGARKLYNQIPVAVANLGGQVAGAADMAFDTPAARAERAAAAAPKPAANTGAFPNSFQDPAYDQAEAYASRVTGVPQDLLRSIRLNGERSNNNQVSSAGGRTPYQIIPSTAQGIKAKYGIDPMASPQNAALAAAYVLHEQAGNPGPHDWNDQVKARAVGGYFGGAAGARNPFGGLSDGNTTVGNYTQRVLNGKTGLSAPFVNPFDPTYANKAMGELNTAQAASNQPFSASGDAGPMPEPPKPELTPKTDFSQSDAVLQSMKPAEVTLKEENQVKWKNFWGGLGKAMSSMPEGAGVGDFFLRLGGGILQGKAAGAEEIDAKHAEYENKLAKWQAALYSNDFQKAEIQHTELMNDWQANQNWALEKYRQGLSVWTSNATPQIVGNNIVFTKRTPDGKVSVQGVPIANMVDADFAVRKAQLYGSMFQEQNAANDRVTGVENSIQGQIALAKAGSILSGSDTGEDTKAAAAAYGPVAAAGFAVSSGMLDNVLGPDQADSLRKDVTKKLMSQGVLPGSPQYADAFQKMMTQQVAMAAFMSASSGNHQLMDKLTQLTPAATLFENFGNYQKQKEQTTTTVDSRGRRTIRSSSTAPGPTDAPDPSAVFQGN
jgi:hypothetical protein